MTDFVEVFNLLPQTDEAGFAEVAVGGFGAAEVGGQAYSFGFDVCFVW